MKKRISDITVSLFAVLALTACAAAPQSGAEKPPEKLTDVLQKDGIVSLPYEYFGRGIFTVNLRTGNGQSANLMIDTGATKSALFKSSLFKLGIGYEGSTAMMIHGINSQGARPVVVIPELFVGLKTYNDFEIVVLEDRLDVKGQKISPMGLIGMDILSEYRIYVDADKARFNLIPKSMPSPKIPNKWLTVNLIENPFVEYDHGLHFMEMRVGDHLLPALLDSGAQDNMMNWSISKYPQLRRARKRLHEKWMLEGAVGSFDPRYLVKTKNVRSGQKYWDESEFIVVDFEGLGILGVEKQPFIIAGSPMLADQTFYIDFAENIMRFRPHKSVGRGKTLTSINTVYDKEKVLQ